MTKLKPNDPCLCSSGKKYKKCCFMQDFNTKYVEEQKYINGQSNTSSDKMKFCIDYYKKMFEKHKIIDITTDITLSNYKSYHIKNYTNKTIMLAERIKNNDDFFLVKSDINKQDCDLIFMYKGVFRIFKVHDILKYDEDILDIVNRRDLGENI